MSEKFTFFWDGPFSNWYTRKMTIDGTVFNCVEQYMMFIKACTFDDYENAMKILCSNSPREQKKLGRQVKNYDDAKWSKIRETVVLQACYTKFTQHEDLKQLLLDTEGTTLVEASPYDKIWGIGLDKYHPDAMIREKWQGQNLLGQVLTNVRESIKS